MAATDPDLRCDACGADISQDEVHTGLAMRLEGRLLCASCLVMRQHAMQHAIAQSPVYRCHDPRRPGCARYSFTTMARVHEHRRILQAGRSFVAPPWPGSPRSSSQQLASNRWHARQLVLTAVIICAATLAGIGSWLALMRAAPTNEPSLRVTMASVADRATDSAPTQLPAPAPPPLPPLVQGSSTPGEPVEEEQARAAPSPQPDSTDGPPAREDHQRHLLSCSAGVLALPAPPAAASARAAPEATGDHGHVAPALSASGAPSEDPPSPSKPSLPSRPETGALGADDAAATDAREAPPATAASTPAALPAAARQDRRPPRTLRGGEGVACQVSVRGPKGARRLLAADTCVPEMPLPWPWPSGVDVHAAAYDRAARRTAIELELPGVSAGGGAALVLHPVRPERRRLVAMWSDGSRRSTPQTLELVAGLWQSMAIPAALGPEWAQCRLFLRLEDERDLGEAQPFLVAGAATRSTSPPEPADCPTALPLLVDPQVASRPDAATRYRQRLAEWSRGLCSDRRFTWQEARILLPGASTWRAELRRALAAAFPGMPPRDGAIDDWVDSSDIVERAVGWPRAWGELDGFRVLIVGWRGEHWGHDGDLARRLDALIDKALTADRRLRRPPLVPVFVLGDLDSAKPEERAVIDGLWRREAERLAARGVPGIDLTTAQLERGREQVARRAARLLADGLRQLEWMLRER